MALIPGARIGPYEIVAALGAGGMGEVYRARDTKLNRDVALKVLPESFANDPDRLARFQREAQVLASLNHPNIAHIHGLEDSGGVRALVMELVEGEDLAQRLTRGAIPIDEALPIAKQIAEALEAAHEQGIIHRDLKPANIKVRPDGTVKVLDFGLAKALDPVGASGTNATISPTISMHATQAGIILGTAAYMSPEQARGRVVDRRADIWAFGVVVFEMLTGNLPFPGEDISHVLARVIDRDPDWIVLPSTLSPALRTCLRRCLVKDPRQRIRDMGDVRLSLEGAFDTEPAVTAVAPPSLRRSAIVWRALTAMLVLSTLAGFSVAYFDRPAKPSVTRFFVFPPEKATFITGQGPGTSAIISPDGRRLAFTARDASGKILLWVRPVDALTAQPLAGTDGASFPFWSPDSRFIAYTVLGGKLVKIDVSGGPPQTVSQTNGNRGGAWNRDGEIVFNHGPGQPLFRVSSAGGEPSPVIKQSSGQAGQVFPSFLPDGHHVLFYGLGRSTETAGIYVGSLDTGDSKRLLGADSGGIFVRETGHLLFVREGTLLAQSFNPNTLTLTNEPFPVAEHVASGVVSGAITFSVSDTGVLAYGVGVGTSQGIEMDWLDRQGKPIGTVGPQADYRGHDLSPDGQRVAAHRHDDAGGDIWISDTSRGTTQRLTLVPSQDNSSPIWSPDGTRIVFGSRRGGRWGLYVKPSNMVGSEEQLNIESDDFVLPTSWSPAGIVYVMNDPKTRPDLWLLPLAGDRKPVSLVHTPANETHGQISPDGKWLAYQSNETGVFEVYVQSFPTGSGRWPISTGAGEFPRWRRDGRELFYMSRPSGGKLMAVDVDGAGSTFVAGAPRELFDAGYINVGHTGPYHTYAVSPDGQRFLIPRPTSGVTNQAGSAPIVVVQNWAAGLRK